MGSPQAVAAQCPEGHAFRRAGTGHVDDGNRRHLGPPGFGRRRSRQQSTPRAERRTSKSRSAYGRGASPAPIRFPPGNFKHSLTLFSKSFSSFPSRSAYGRGASPAPIRFPPGNFKHSLTLFSKSFSSFPRGTCSLLVSRLYLALDGVYLPIWAAFPNNPNR
ncbi:hypothetical protein ZWY2020_052372 [Hordeum vulgare]|nr:hypothetical protein ZWY2020_052372 [Hordeum vulgare]